MTQKTSRRKRARIRKRRKVARCIPSRNSSPRSNSRRSNPFSSNKQRPSSTGRRKCRVRLSNRRRRRSLHGDTGWISSVARRRLSGKTTKVSLSTTRNFTLSYVVDSHDVSTEPRATRKSKQAMLEPLVVNGSSPYHSRFRFFLFLSDASKYSSRVLRESVKENGRDNRAPRVSSRRVTFSQREELKVAKVV